MFSSQKVILLLVDGMRPDGLLESHHPFLSTILNKFSYCLNARTVSPSLTLPCHMSLFHSVDPERHGITSNTYVPQPRPIQGICEVLSSHELSSSFFYSWEPLRDITRVNSLAYSVMLNRHNYSYTDDTITDYAVQYISKEQPDFAFVYLGDTDEIGGHDYGWMSKDYIKCVYNALSCAERIFNAMSDDYALLILADHGGHGRSHGTMSDEDMTIPILAYGKTFKKGFQFKRQLSIKDIAPTITSLLNLKPSPKWEGRSII